MGLTFYIFKFEHRLREDNTYWMPVYMRTKDEESATRLGKLIVASIGNHTFLHNEGIEMYTPFVTSEELELVSVYTKDYMGSMSASQIYEMGVRVRVDQLKLGLQNKCLLIEPMVDIPDYTSTLNIPPMKSITVNGIKAPAYRIMGREPLDITPLQLWWK